MSVKERIELLGTGADPSSFLQIAKSFEGTGIQIGFDPSEKRITARKDIRQIIKKKLAEENVSIRQLAAKIGMNYQALSSGLSGSRSIPFDKLEEIWAILDL